MKNKITPKNDGIVPASWVPFPRDILTSYKNGDLSRDEFFVYCYLRIQGNPYGICSTHLEAIRSDVFRKEGRKKTPSKNYINKILLSLKSKRFLFYYDRTGRSGSFDVYFSGFRLSNEKFTDIKHLFEEEYSNRKVYLLGGTNSEANTEVEEAIQRSDTLENIDITSGELVDENNQFRGYNNDNDTKNEIENTDISVSNKEESKGKIQLPYECKNPTDSYTPKNRYEEDFAHKVALEVGEKCMDWYLSLIRNGNFWALEKAVGELHEDIAKGNQIESKPRYLNGIITRMLKEKIGK